jgi:hypothetical protein
MTDTLPKPKLRRWRWLVVGFLFVLAISVWLVFADVDTRFLGTWKVESNPSMSMTFGRFGIVHITTPKRTWHLRWSVEGDLLVLGGSEEARKGSLKQRLLQVAEKWSGDTILPKGRDEMEIISASPHRIHLVTQGQGGMPDHEQVLVR